MDFISISDLLDICYCHSIRSDYREREMCHVLSILILGISSSHRLFEIPNHFEKFSPPVWDDFSREKKVLRRAAFLIVLCFFSLLFSCLSFVSCLCISHVFVWLGQYCRTFSCARLLYGLTLQSCCILSSSFFAVDFHSLALLSAL